MNQEKTRWWLVVGSGVLVGLVLAACVALTLPWGGSRFASNGEQIYFTATSQRGTPISSDMGMGMMRGGRMTCASCHGPDGRGGRVQMMMQVFEVPDIRYQTLTSEEHGEEMEHEAFTDDTIKQAITEGIEPNGESLDWPMPRWSMSDEDLDDLIEFLKALN